MMLSESQIKIDGFFHFLKHLLKDAIDMKELLAHPGVPAVVFNTLMVSCKKTDISLQQVTNS